MSDFEQSSAQKEARHTTPGRPWTPGEEPRQDALGRYLAVVAAAASARRVKGPEPAREGEPPEPPATAAPEPPAKEPATLRVRDVMQVPAASVPGDVPFLDVAHTLAREQVSVVPVVDADDHVIGVVSESTCSPRPPCWRNRAGTGPSAGCGSTVCTRRATATRPPP
ncbi:CBS domain-containing protein [Streptomyces sp. MN13]